MLNEKIGIIGAGKIGSAIARGVVGAGLAPKEKVIASDVSDALRAAVAKELGIKATADNVELCEFAEIVILAVKPQIVGPVAKEIAKKVGKSKLVVSVAAGVPIARIEACLTPGARVVRVMPNIACVVGAGAAGFAGGAHATAADLEKVSAIL
ncbi:MAG TPA: prephenate dehydrogenase/arogenate dehydrogenase family protein, partial [Candidatus Binatia bacterium]|nr:prephenate dehydrogenase/arogenate dehydrogenase family protein [Candidatus Binatia bacterium]